MRKENRHLNNNSKSGKNQSREAYFFDKPEYRVRKISYFI